jgi:hypothetical protein
MPVMMIAWLAWLAAWVSEVLVGGVVSAVAGGASVVGWVCARAAVETDAKAIASTRVVIRKVCEAMESPSAHPKVSIRFILRLMRGQSNPFVQSFPVRQRRTPSFSFVFPRSIVQVECVSRVS